MRLSSAAVIGAWILCSCSARTPPPPTPTADAGTSSPAAPAAGPRAASPQALQAFMTYQHALLEIERRLPRSSGLQPSPGERTLMLELARDEEEARKRSGLSEDEIERWEALVFDVMAARALTEAGRTGATAEKIDRLVKKFPGLGSRPDGGEPSEIREIRARYGGAPVDLVLSQEPTLRQQWEALTAEGDEGR